MPLDRYRHVILVVTKLQLLSFLDANSNGYIAIDVMFPICKIVEKISCL